MKHFLAVYSKRLEHTSIFCRDALDVIRKSDHEDTFHYIDSPYFQADMGHYGGGRKVEVLTMNYTVANFPKAVA
jgi:DNA adenine methylase